MAAYGCDRLAEQEAEIGGRAALNAEHDIAVGARGRAGFRDEFMRHPVMVGVGHLLFLSIVLAVALDVGGWWAGAPTRQCRKRVA